MLVIALTAVAAKAQNPIDWKMSVKMNSETEGVMTITATVQPGWHLYSTSLPEGGPKPTKFSFEVKGVRLQGNFTASPALVTKEDPMFGSTLSWWDRNVTFKRSFTITDPADAKISVNVSFMACNDENCMPPKTVTLTHSFSK